jgi:hypothetical protein
MRPAHLTGQQVDDPTDSGKNLSGIRLDTRQTVRYPGAPNWADQTVVSGTDGLEDENSTVILSGVIKDLTWFAPRSVWKKRIGGKVYYFKGDGSGEKTIASYAAALMQLADRQEKRAIEIRADLATWQKEQFTDVSARHGERIAQAVVWGRKEMPLSEAVESYLTDKLARHEQGEIVMATYEQCRFLTRRIQGVLEHLKPSVVSVNQINADVLSRFRQEVLTGNKNTLTTRSHLLRYCKWFVKWCWENGKLYEMPRNIDSFAKVKIFKETEVAVFTFDQVRKILGCCVSDHQKLYVLLMLNCGFAYQDIADLKPSEYADGFIDRARSKTDIPGRWYLWTETRRLLDMLGQRKGEHLLTTMKGGCLIKRRIENKKMVSSNAIESSLKSRLFGINGDVPKMLEEWGIRGTPYMFRKTVANEIERLVDRETAKTYLAHADGSVAEKNYLQRKYEKLTAALKMVETLLMSEQPADGDQASGEGLGGYKGDTEGCFGAKNEQETEMKKPL